MIRGRDEEVLIDARMVEVVGDGPDQSRHDFQGLYVLFNL